VTTIFEDGFESGDFSAWDGTYVSAGETANVVTSNPYQGTYNARFVTNGDGTYESAYCYKNLNEEPVVYARGYFYLSQTSQERGPTLIMLLGDAYELAYARLRPDGTDKWELGYRDSGSLQTVTTTNSFPGVNTWVCVELYVKIGSGDGEAKLYVNGTEILSVSSLTNDDKGNVDLARFGIYDLGYSQVLTLDVDCIVVADEYIGPMATVITVSDSISLSDAVLVNKTFTITDTVGLTDTILTNKNLTIQDVISLLDTVLTNKNIISTDSISLSDAVYTNKNLIVTESVTLSDSVLVNKILTVLDSVGLSDAVIISRPWPGVLMVLNVKERTLQLAVSKRVLEMLIKKRKLELNLSE